MTETEELDIAEELLVEALEVVSGIEAGELDAWSKGKGAESADGALESVEDALELAGKAPGTNDDLDVSARRAGRTDSKIATPGNVN